MQWAPFRLLPTEYQLVGSDWLFSVCVISSPEPSSSTLPKQERNYRWNWKLCIAQSSASVLQGCWPVPSFILSAKLGKEVTFLPLPMPCAISAVGAATVTLCFSITGRTRHIYPRHASSQLWGCKQHKKYVTLKLKWNKAHYQTHTQRSRKHLFDCVCINTCVWPCDMSSFM